MRGWPSVFGSLSFPGLWILPTEVLFDVADADLDWPTPGVPGRNLGAGVGEVAGDEEVVSLDAVGVADYDEANQAGLLYLTPEDITDVDESVDGGAAMVDSDGFPLVGAGLRGNLGRGGKPAASDTWPTAFPGGGWGGFAVGGVPA